MAIDPEGTARLVTREVRTDARDGRATRVVVARRSYATTQDDLWDAVTNPERIPRWFLPVSGDLQPGGRYQLEGNAEGTVERCDPPRSFEVTWEFAGQVSWLKVELAPSADGATLELAHEAPVDPDFWAQYGPGAAGIGWDLGLMGLGLHLDSAAGVDPADADDWVVSEPGVAFVRQAAADWADCAIADGDDPRAAQEAAERTVAFYTVPPQ
ncbi:SRPBCC family protein [Egibacter rhizosphaerae]|uniref:SRPBCC family protein n=1 Tax=Egibacter rhizosphaerae TaxID=1670831 RepID=A0A411YB65_9ACTN|nr:SRPBCC family protein [Egibacter rhizosphaerae]QBI18444.1 SRPBCC family protein [Egibacter rhizosphaerae]